MTRKRTYQEVKEYIESFDYELLSKEYVNNKTKLQLKCPKGHIIETRWNDFRKGVRCKFCSDRYYDKFTYEYVKEYIENEGYKLLSTEYTNANTDILVECSEGHIFKTRFGRFKRGSRCRECYFIYENNKTTVHSYEYVKNKMSLEGFKLLSDEYVNARTKLKIQCPNGHVFEQKYNSFQQGYRCPYCYESKGERKISKTLDEFNISYVTQYRFDDCKFKNTLPFDFYLSDYNCCIEFDGEQHHKIIEHFGGLDKFIETKIRDTIKNEYCKKNNIKLVRIPYWDFDRIEEILINELKI